MIDKLHFFTTKYKVKNTDFLSEKIYKPSKKDPQQKEKKVLYLNTPKTKEDKKYLNPYNQDFSLTIENQTLFLNFNPAKWKTSNPLNPSTIEETKQKVNELEVKLIDYGIYTNLQEANISRIDLTKNIYLNNSYSDYLPVLEALEAKRLRPKQYIDTMSFENTQRELIFYHKDQELQQVHHLLKKDIEDLKEIKGKDIMRIELSCKKSQAVQRILKIKTAVELFKKKQEELKFIFTNQASEPFNRMNPNSPEFQKIVNTKAFINYCKILKLQDKALAVLIYQSEPEAIERSKKIIKETSNRMSAYRYLKRIDKLRGEVESFKTHTFKDYFDEILDKLKS